MHRTRNQIALFISLLICAVLGLTLLLPVSAGQPAPQPQTFAIVDGQRQNTDVIQVAYEPPPGVVLQTTLEAPPTDESPTAEATQDSGGVIIINNPPADKTDQTPFNLTYLVYGAVIAVLGGGGLYAVIDRVRKSKSVLDAGEALYQDKVNEDLRNHVRESFVAIRDINLKLLEIFDKMTDGKPNVIDESTVDYLRSIQPAPPEDKPN